MEVVWRLYGGFMASIGVPDAGYVPIAPAALAVIGVLAQ